MGFKQNISAMGFKQNISAMGFKQNISAMGFRNRYLEKNTRKFTYYILLYINYFCQHSTHRGFYIPCPVCLGYTYA